MLLALALSFVYVSFTYRTAQSAAGSTKSAPLALDSRSLTLALLRAVVINFLQLAMLQVKNPSSLIAWIGIFSFKADSASGGYCFLDLSAIGKAVLTIFIPVRGTAAFVLCSVRALRQIIFFGELLLVFVLHHVVSRVFGRPAPERNPYFRAFTALALYSCAFALYSFRIVRCSQICRLRRRASRCSTAATSARATRSCSRRPRSRAALPSGPASPSSASCCSRSGSSRCRPLRWRFSPSTGTICRRRSSARAGAFSTMVSCGVHDCL